MITQKDISAACGLSVATVSKALCDSSDIADETKLRVRTMAEKMGYGKEMPARRTRISFRIGIMVNGEEGTDFQHELIDEVQKRLLERGYDLVLFSSAAGAGGDTGKPGLLSRAKVLDLDGIFLFNLGPEEDVFHPGEDRDLWNLIRGDIPVIAVDSKVISCECILPCYEEGVRELLCFARGRGHSRIAFLYGKKEQEKDNTAGFLPGQSIEAAVRGLLPNVPESYICGIEKDNEEVAFNATLRLLEGEETVPPTCIIFGGEEILEGGLSAFRSQNIRIPEDISAAAMIVSGGGRYREQGITYCSWSPSQIAEEAVRRMIGRMNLPDAAFIRPHTRFVRGELYEGRSISALF
ncbi:transcriptional regulator, LacI family [Sarcina sp. DSM 11001]|uniref:LacI family DNA-binding transcriptional regulator n=1 Tax=Sarcina sp. DSM 11001 TaxID=1798184 RepID=UPI00088D7224|nr:LacI family DNA-binding transcriptional regulator [Sarcina sp. DSM 11001]SDL07956.1 transcriptional regulator, LacI family [Sarcina sp. DSM 11001]